ncbi:2S globulin [Artemisia annua]|uniref:2S globulin n=1 Tax=Artemisia annua TaxID=35608 RepID=A0A2U1MGU2_ARTAN|nr:2S globulin [Artemisia annua]
MAEMGLTLWKKYGHVIDYVNSQFYTCNKLTVSHFVNHLFIYMLLSYAGGQLLARFISKGNIGLPPNDGYFEARKELKRQGKLGGIFVWCGDESKDFGFRYGQETQAYLFCILCPWREDKNVKFSDVPINPNVEFHYILAFAIDYTASSSPSPTNGNFSVFWDKHNLGPFQVSSIKSQHSNVKVALSLGGDTVKGGKNCTFIPLSVDSWVSNAVSSLTVIIQKYNLDGIDIDYEHFDADPETFAECIGKLITTLKNNSVITFASIAPLSTEGSGGLSPKDGFFKACNRLKSEGKLVGIFVWSADSSKNLGFRYENESQALLAVPHLTRTTALSSFK